jgi:hypothetical protein
MRTSYVLVDPHHHGLAGHALAPEHLHDPSRTTRPTAFETTTLGVVEDLNSLALPP